MALQPVGILSSPQPVETFAYGEVESLKELFTNPIDWWYNAHGQRSPGQKAADIKTEAQALFNSGNYTAAEAQAQAEADVNAVYNDAGVQPDTQPSIFSGVGWLVLFALFILVIFKVKQLES